MLLPSPARPVSSERKGLVKGTLQPVSILFLFIALQVALGNVSGLEVCLPQHSKGRVGGAASPKLTTFPREAFMSSIQ